MQRCPSRYDREGFWATIDGLDCRGISAQVQRRHSVCLIRSGGAGLVCVVVDFNIIFVLEVTGVAAVSATAASCVINTRAESVFFVLREDLQLSIPAPTGARGISTAGLITLYAVAARK